jgi:hypothetical protein
VTEPAYQAFRTALEGRDVDAAVALFAPDAVFLSPVVHRPYVGREALRLILTGVATVFEDFRYTAEYAGDGGHVLAFAARVGERELQGVDILRGADGALTELTVMVRPYSAATALRDRMAALLA